MVITSTKTDTKLSYRPYQDSDMPAVLELWEKYSGWGAITEEQFTKWYLNGPYGPCIIIVAVDEHKKIVAQKSFVPSQIYLNGQQIKAFRLSAPILDKAVRYSNIRDNNHPGISMYRYAIEVALQQGYQLAYCFPAEGWTSVMKLLPQFGLPQAEMATFNCFTISLKSHSNYLSTCSDLIVSVVNQFTEEYEDLWNEAVVNIPISCSVVRNVKWLNWKLGGYMVFEVRSPQDFKLSGYIALNKKTGLLVDMLARTITDLQKNLMAVVNKIHCLNDQKKAVDFNEINGMYTPLMRSVINNMEHQINDFKFAFGCSPLHRDIVAQQIQPASWYMMPND